jgi:hypothetical protein
LGGALVESAQEIRVLSVQVRWGGKKKGDAATVRPPATLLARAPPVACVASQIDAEYDRLLQKVAEAARARSADENRVICQVDFPSFGTLPVDNVFFECDDALALLHALRW